MMLSGGSPFTDVSGLVVIILSTPSVRRPRTCCLSIFSFSEDIKYDKVSSRRRLEVADITVDRILAMFVRC